MAEVTRPSRSASISTCFPTAAGPGLLGRRVPGQQRVRRESPGAPATAIPGSPARSPQAAIAASRTKNTYLAARYPRIAARPARNRHRRRGPQHPDLGPGTCSPTTCPIRTWVAPTSRDSIPNAPCDASCAKPTPSATPSGSTPSKPPELIPLQQKPNSPTTHTRPGSPHRRAPQHAANHPCSRESPFIFRSGCRRPDPPPSHSPG